MTTLLRRTGLVLPLLLVGPALAEGAGLPPLQTVPHVDLERYMGTWYDIASFPQRFQKGCTGTTATYTLRPDGTVAAGRVLFDAEPLRAKLGGGLMDGLKVDARGNIWATGPGGVLILSPEGKHLGTILTGTSTANCCFGGADGTTLYITANNQLLRLATRVKGNGF